MRLLYRVTWQIAARQTVFHEDVDALFAGLAEDDTNDRDGEDTDQDGERWPHSTSVVSTAGPTFDVIPPVTRGRPQAV